ncbi:hypothetical protein LINGRAHAP2_LOCUS4231 [Linum grandiflorum]
MVKLPTKGDVLRIMNLKRWSFRDRNITADGWCPWAGRSNLEDHLGLIWLKFDGIPLHLRSPSLFSQLGNCCGRYINYMVEGCTWNSVRVKVKAAGVIPHQIPVCFKGESFNVRVAVEERRDFVDGWKTGGSEVYVRTPTCRNGSRKSDRQASGSKKEKGKYFQVQSRDKGVGKSAEETEGDMIEFHTAGQSGAQLEEDGLEVAGKRGSAIEPEEGEMGQSDKYDPKFIPDKEGPFQIWWRR